MNEIPMADGKVTSSKIPGFHLIPTEALVRVANRFTLGTERKGDKAWNAITNNQEVLTNKELILHRIGHIISHALKLRDKVVSGVDPLASDDDASAIAWGGMFLCCATEALSSNCPRESPSADLGERFLNANIAEANSDPHRRSYMSNAFTVGMGILLKGGKTTKVTSAVETDSGTRVFCDNGQVYDSRNLEKEEGMKLWRLSL